MKNEVLRIVNRVIVHISVMSHLQTTYFPVSDSRFRFFTRPSFKLKNLLLKYECSETRKF